MTPREIALSICEPWFNGDPCEGCKCHKVCTKLVERIETAIQARVPETNFGIMAQAVDSTEDDHIADANKMVPTINGMETVEPVAYVTGYFDGRCVIKPIEHVVFPTGMALYRSPPNQSEDALGMVEPVAWLYPEGLAALKAGKCWTAYGTKQVQDRECDIPLYLAPPVPTWTQSHWTEYERGIVATERECIAAWVEDMCADLDAKTIANGIRNGGNDDIRAFKEKK